MQLQDLIKLIYQNEFAGGHLIKNEIESLKLLTDETDSLLIRDTSKASAFEYIGNGLYRLYLTALKNSDVNLSTVNRFFIYTANNVNGTVHSFEEKTNALIQCCEDKLLPFSPQEAEAYLRNYKNMGYPPVSHSKAYKNAYSPAYRIVKKEFKQFFEIFRKIDYLMQADGSVTVAIDGKSGGGKSTLSALLSEIYDCNIFHMDDFFLRPELKTEERLNEIGGNVDYVRFKDEVIKGLKSKSEFRYQLYDCSKKALGEFISAVPKKLNIIEGVYSMHPTLINNYDLKIFLNISDKKQSSRILKRNGEFMHKRFINEWIPLENRYFNDMKIREQSDLVYNTDFH
jgi:uridine kinase